MSKLKLQKEREKLTVWEEIFCWLIYKKIFDDWKSYEKYTTSFFKL